MAKKVLIISTSARRNSNSDILADAFMNGAIDAGNEVEKVSLTDKQIAFCRGCFGCLKLGRCVIKDDAPEITERIDASNDSQMCISMTVPEIFRRIEG